MKIVFINPSMLVLLMIIIIASAQEESCPDEVAECAVDPCEGQMCPRFYNAECRPNLCFGGLCTANFFFRGSNVTDRCDVITCDARKCAKRRQCMEEVRPSMCPPGFPDCRQALHTRCVLPPDLDRPMTCLDINCTDGEVCRMRLRGHDCPPVVNCFPPERVSDCVPGTCNEGLECVDDGPSVRCVIPSTDTTTASPPDGTTTEDTSTTEPDTDPTLTPFTTVPPSASCNPEDELACNSDMLLCEETEVGPICTSASTCEELLPICQRSAGNTSCQMQLSGPECSPPSSCSDVVCQGFEHCVVRSDGVPGHELAECVPSVALSCEGLDCPPDLDFCLISVLSEDGNATLAECVDRETAKAFSTCETLGEGYCPEPEVCLDLQQQQQQVAVFCSIPNCEKLPEGQCPEGTSCVGGIGGSNFPFTSACMPHAAIAESSRGVSCEMRAGICEVACEESLLNGSVVSSFCVSSRLLPQSCDEVACEEEGEECVMQFIDSSPENVRASCISIDTFLINLASLLDI